LELLKSLRSQDYLKGFHLVGGTALALYYGHRKSIYLHFFTNKGFNTNLLLLRVLQPKPRMVFVLAHLHEAGCHHVDDHVFGQVAGQSG